MSRQDRIVAGATFSVLVVLWLGFLIHRSPLFAGSLLGGAFGVVGAALFLVPVIYTIVKRSARLRRAVVERKGFDRLLQAHIYFGLLGSLLAIIHSGHRFESVLGVVLTTSMLLSVLTGFLGQYYQRHVAENLREKRTQLDGLWHSLGEQSSSYARVPLGPETAVDLLPLASAAADLQYSVDFQERVRGLFNTWLAAHIAFSVVFYLSLVLHVWAGIYFGLRWFR